MRCLVVLLAVTAIYAKVLARLVPEENTAYGYLANIGIPEAERLRKAEENDHKNSKIIGGQPSQLGMIPYQEAGVTNGVDLMESCLSHGLLNVAIVAYYRAGIIVSIVGTQGVAVCSGALISDARALTAAHCWFDGRNQAWKFTVVLESLKVFTGGLRLDSTTVVTHPQFSAPNPQNDIAVVHLPVRVTTTATISPIALPSGMELYDSYLGAAAIASGYGINSQSETTNVNQFLSYVTLPIISNAECLPTYPTTLQPTNICTSGIGPRGTCHGDSGGPLAVYSNRRWVLIGLTSFGSPTGCEAGLPTVFTRITSYINFIHQNM